MPDFLPVVELAAKSVRDAFSAVGALVHALIPPVKVYAAADALADREAENEVDEPADTKPLSVCPCEALEDSCFWCEEHPVGEFAFGYSQYLPLPKSPAASATDAVVGNPPPDVPPTSGGADLTWIEHVIPAITDVLAEHQLHLDGNPDIEMWRWECHGSDDVMHDYFPDRQAWREHVAPLIAERLEAVTLALPEESISQDMGGPWAAATFPQYQRPLQK